MGSLRLSEKNLDWDWETAQTALDKAHQLDPHSNIIRLWPDYHWAHFNLGKTYLFSGEAERALEEIEKNPENVWRAIGLVMAYSSLGRQADAG